MNAAGIFVIAALMPVKWVWSIRCGGRNALYKEEEDQRNAIQNIHRGEDSLIIEIMTEDDDAKIKAIAGEIKRANKQETVLVQKIQNEQWFV